MDLSYYIEVKSYSGYTNDERPESFTLGSTIVQISDIIDRWYEPDHSYFKVLSADGKIFIIRRHFYLHIWELVSAL